MTFDLCHLLLYTQYGLLPQLPADIAADRKGRRSSDVTVGYIRTRETPHHCFFSRWKPRRGYHATEALHSGEETTRGFSLILPTGQNS
ncbi:hypothetical protein ATANTOWER_030330 [Ataeniobius toweri]|uniref:Uncharacterized protein n=1 Tax=Ataeniobius toweri TaxID=208326 RepID=A0ABU7C427_9TELE|nr:hypothetical protein [Ataeniobius toweri]